MTEAEWLAGVDVMPLLEHYSANTDVRKLRLFAVACCRRKSKYFADPRCLSAVNAAEMYADDENCIGHVDTAHQACRLAHAEWRAKQGYRGQMVWLTTALVSLTAPGLHLFPVLLDLQRVPIDSERGRNEEQANQAGLVREIFGNPFRPVTLDPRWQSETVVALAGGIYADRAFDRMPILADALEEAGCNNADVLSHCRWDGPHVRGCWVVDLLLGKS